MPNQNQEHTFSILPLVGFSAGVLVGGLAGAGAMLLLAPQSGKRTRARIQAGSLELRDRATEAVEDAVSQSGFQARHIRATARRQARALEHRGQQVLKEQKKRFSTLVEAGKKDRHGSPA